MHRIDGDVSKRQILVVVAVGSHIAPPRFQAHLDVQLAAFAHGCNRHVAIQHFDVGVGLNLPAQHLSRPVYLQPGHASTLTDHLERYLLKIEDDVGGVFHHAWDGTEFVRHAFDTHRGNGGAFDGAQQHAAQSSSDGGPESALERLSGEHSVTLS